MDRIMVAGIGTDVGKTVVSAILATLFKGDYWKPIQCGNKDTDVIEKWMNRKIHPAAYSFQAPLSPHHAARLEQVIIDIDSIKLPNTKRPLIIEGVGGIFVPLTTELSTMDLFKKWDCKWVIVSKHYLGSINHTLLTIEALKSQGVAILGLIFNGEPNSDSEDAIFGISKLPLLGRLLPEENINFKTIQRYADLWNPLI